MADSLIKLAEEDPTFQIRQDDATGQTVISGMGELHLDVLLPASCVSSRCRRMWASPA